MSNRVLIVGGPKTGKTTLADQLSKSNGYPVTHTDDFIEKGWSEASAHVAELLQKPGPWIIEGVAGTRALRKMLNQAAKPPDIHVIRLTEPHTARSTGQVTMAKGEQTVWAGIEDKLKELGLV